MDSKIRWICRLVVICVLGVFLAQGVMAAPVKRESKAADRTLQMELRDLHQQEMAAKSPEERSAIRAQMNEKRHQALEAKRSQGPARKGGK